VNNSCKDSELITDMLPADQRKKEKQSSADKHRVGREAPHEDRCCDMDLAGQAYHTHTRSNVDG
jgi:hypothetical protein